MSTTASPQECLEQFQACVHLVAEHLPKSTPNKSGDSVFQAASAHIHSINHHLMECGEAASPEIPTHKIITHAHTAVVAATTIMELAEVDQHPHSEQLLRKLRALNLAANMLLQETRENTGEPDNKPNGCW